MKIFRIILEIISYMTTILFNILTFTSTNSSTDIYLSIVLIIVLFFTFRLWYKLDNIKEKILAQKKFNEYVFIDMANHFTNEILKLDLQCIELKKMADIYKPYIETPDKKLAIERQKTITINKIIEYNLAFKDWHIAEFEFGTGTKQTMFKSSLEYHELIKQISEHQDNKLQNNTIPNKNKKKQK